MIRIERPGVALIAAAAALRLFAAFTSIGFDHPNEPFRLLEPLASLQGWSAVLPWEWTQGLLSELPVRAQLPLARLFFALGLSPASQIIGLKALYALLSLLVVIASGNLAAAVSPPQLARRAQLCGYAIAALWPELIYQSVRLMDYSLEAALLAASWLLLTRGSRLDSGSRREGSANLLSGLILGLALFVRPQSGLHLIPLLVGAWAFSGTGRAQAMVCLGYGLASCAGGVIEFAVTSRPHAFFLQPLWNYFHFNAIEGGAARDYGVAPAYRYLSDLAKYFGWFGFAAGLIALGAAVKNVVKNTRQSLAPAFAEKWAQPRFRRTLALLFAFAFPALVHSLIAHKEARFLFGSLWLFIPASTAVAVELLCGRPRKYAYALTLLLACGAVVSSARASHRWLNRDADVRQFSAVSKLLPRTALEIQVHTDPVTFPAGFLLQRPGTLCYPDPNRPLFPCSSTPSGLPRINVVRGPDGWVKN